MANVGRIVFTPCPSSLERCHSTLKIQMMFQKDNCCRLLPECFLSRLNHNLVPPKYLIKIQLLKKDIKETLWCNFPKLSRLGVLCYPPHVCLNRKCRLWLDIILLWRIKVTKSNGRVDSNNILQSFPRKFMKFETILINKCFCCCQISENWHMTFDWLSKEVSLLLNHISFL